MQAEPHQALRQRHTALRNAENCAVQLFDQILQQNLVRAGRSEEQVNADIYELAETKFGVTTHWHKRIVRSGKNTLCPYDDNPPVLTIQEDDIVFIDLGPVFDEWEADFGRTYVIGDDEVKQQLVRDGEECWTMAKQHFDATSGLTAADFFDFIEGLANERGWQMGQWHSGHLIGEFPHDRPAEKIHNFIMPGNHRTMRGLDGNGQPLEWILEIHFVDPERQIGAFFEQLLTVD